MVFEVIVENEITPKGFQNYSRIYFAMFLNNLLIWSKQKEGTYEAEKSQTGAKMEDEVDKGEFASFAGHQKDEANAPVFGQVTMKSSS